MTACTFHWISFSTVYTNYAKQDGILPLSTGERCQNSFCRYDLELHAVHLSSHGEVAVIAIVYKYGRADPLLTKVQRPLYLALLTATYTFIRAATVLLPYLLIGYVNALNSAIVCKVELGYVHVHESLMQCIICLVFFSNLLPLLCSYGT